LPIGNAFPNLFHTLQKISGRAKVCALCIEEKKKFHPEGVKRKHINASSVNFHCAVWGVFWNARSSEMWRCKIRRVGYYMHKFMTNKMKKVLSSTGPKTMLDMLVKRNTPPEPEIESQLSINYSVFTHVHVAKGSYYLCHVCPYVSLFL